jgi:hypothetical protein
MGRVGRHDHFFELGGNSLLAVRLSLRLRQRLDVVLPVSLIFDRPALSAFAEGVVDAQLAQFDPEELARLAALVR